MGSTTYSPCIISDPIWAADMATPIVSTPSRKSKRRLSGGLELSRSGLMHIDVWSNGNIHRPSEFNLGYLWNPGHWEGEKLMFWDLPPAEGRHIEYQSAR